MMKVDMVQKAKTICLMACFEALLLCCSFGVAPAAASPVDEEQEKIETPTVEKEICEVDPDGSMSWGDVADASTGVEVAYRITGTLPSNWDDFTTYYYEFHDALDRQLVIDVASVKISVGGGGFTI